MLTSKHNCYNGLKSKKIKLLLDLTTYIQEHIEKKLLNSHKLLAVRIRSRGPKPMGNPPELESHEKHISSHLKQVALT